MLLLGTRRRDLGRICHAVALLLLGFLPFFLLFPQAVAIHPYAYPVLVVPLATLALFAALPLSLVPGARRAWPIVLAAMLGGMVLSASNLRDYMVARPLDTDHLLIQLPGLSISSPEEAPSIEE